MICLSVVSALIGTFLLDKYELFPKRYVCQSQLVINPYVDKDDDNVKSMDLLKYNENYSLLVYSPSFLKEVNSNLEKKYTDYLKIKSKLKVLYSSTSQVLTVQVISTDKKESINLANTILKELCNKGNELFSHSKLSILSNASVVDVISNSKTTILSVLCMFFFILYGTVFMTYTYLKHRHKDEKRSRKNSRRKSHRC